MKRIFNYLAIVIALLEGSACQKENVGHVNSAESKIVDSELFDTLKSESISKSMVKKKLGYIYISDTWGNMQKYQTIKLKKGASDMMQEWLYEDLRTDLGCQYYTQPNDEDGSVHGFYYPWGGGHLSDITQEDWDDIIYGDEGAEIQETGFHIPTLSDMQYFNSIVGENNGVKSLNVKYDGRYYDDPIEAYDYSTSVASFWLEDNNNPHKIENCGVILFWDNNSFRYKTKFGILRTNDEAMCCNVRLVRTLKKNQW